LISLPVLLKLKHMIHCAMSCWDVLCLVVDINVAMLLLHQWLTQPGQYM